jgi:hypothetical protein
MKSSSPGGSETFYANVNLCVKRISLFLLLIFALANPAAGIAPRK